MPPESDDHPSIASTRLIAAATALLHAGRTIDPELVCEAAGLDEAAVARTFGTTSCLLVATAEVLCSEPAFPPAQPGDTAADPFVALQRLGEAHLAYVDAHPERFGAILQLTAAAVCGAGELLRPLAARNVRSRHTVAAHLWLLRTAGAIAPDRDVEATASAFVDTLVGIEMCFAINDDPGLRVRAYRETCLTHATRL